MIAFTKMHGIGNDYVYVDCFAPAQMAALAGRDVPALARVMSDRHRGVGSDGLILITPPTRGVAADARMEMYNADGSRGEMCGNGIRCVAKYVIDHGIAGGAGGGHERTIRIETDRGVLTLVAYLENGKVARVRVDMGGPILEKQRIPVELPRWHAGPIVRFPLNKYIPIGSGAWMEDCRVDLFMTCVSMGNPHLVIFCGEVASVPLETIGPFLERQPIFPNRINVHFVQCVSRREAIMRTWERGSGVTQACGTGACAVLVAGVLEDRLDRAATLHLPGGDLEIEWAGEGREGAVTMTGPAEEVFTGVWSG